MSVVPGTNRLEGKPPELWSSLLLRLQSRGYRNVDVVHNIHIIHHELFGGTEKNERDHDLTCKGDRSESAKEAIEELCNAATSGSKLIHLLQSQANIKKYINFQNEEGIDFQGQDTVK